MICQFCGKRIKDDEIQCPYCKGDLTQVSQRNKSVNEYSQNKYKRDYQSGSRINNNINRNSEYNSRNEDMTNNDMTTVIPSINDNNSYRPDNLDAEIPRNRNASSGTKREYYRYNPDSKHKQTRSSNSRVNNRAENYINQDRTRTPRKKRGFAKGIIKFILLALLGIIIGISVYAITSRASSWFKNMKNPIASISETIDNNSLDTNAQSDKITASKTLNDKPIEKKNEEPKTESHTLATSGSKEEVESNKLDESSKKDESNNSSKNNTSDKPINKGSASESNVEKTNSSKNDKSQEDKSSENNKSDNTSEKISSLDNENSNELSD